MSTGQYPALQAPTDLWERDGLVLRKGGLLSRIRWKYDEAQSVGSWVEKDVTADSHRHLFDLARLEPGFTLGDLFRLIQANPALYPILGNWCEEIISSAQTQAPAESAPDSLSDPDAIEFLELYWMAELDEAQSSLDGLSRPQFHGLGFPLESPRDGFPVGDRIPWGLMGSEPGDLLGVPLILRPTMILCDASHRQPPLEIPARTFSLGDILNGVIWELSFLGSPEMRRAATQEILEEAEHPPAAELTSTKKPRLRRPPHGKRRKRKHH